MPAVARLKDLDTGHECFPPRANTASTTVFVNGSPAVNVGTSWLSHCCGPVCHPGTQSLGSGTVNIEGKPIARIGDLVSCGSACASGSGNVFSN